MAKNNNRHGKSMLKLCATFLFPLSLFGGVVLTTQSTDAASGDYRYYYEEKVDVTNSSFREGSTPYASGNSLSGWSAIETESKARGMLIDVGSGENSESDNSTSTFSRYQTTYMLNANPGAKGSDSRILMINSKESNDKSGKLAQKGYRSNSVTLDANSYYRFQVSVKTSNNGDDDAFASVYLSGLKDSDEKDFKIGYEYIRSGIWKEYYIFVATGSQAQTVTLDLYLGSANGGRSTGAVFFDEVSVNKYSQNAFYELCVDYGYNGSDVYENFNNKTVFLIDGLQDENFKIDTSSYNFNFENSIKPNSDTLGDEWSTPSKSNGHAIIADVRNMQPADFKNLTGYSYTGNNLAYNNKQALILYTDNDGGYVQAQSKAFNINAHEIYKISLQLKVSDTLEGSFYLKVQENEEIYSLYPSLLSKNSQDKNYYELQNGQTSGITSNVTNNFTNDYQTVELYVKGHSLYNTSVNLQLCLGDSENKAKGCVVVDDITIEKANYEEYSNASNSVELQSFSSAPSTIANGYFNATESEEYNSYPIKASDWTILTENDKNQSGVIYLYDNDQYKSMYSSAQWTGIFPGNPTTDETQPNNVYMMFNDRNSYQYIQSSSYTLEKNSYYSLSFDYFNQNGLNGVNPSKIKVEVIDENGITLFTQNNISSLNTWNRMNIVFHTAETVSNNISVKISLGEKEDKVGGLVFIDNVEIKTSEEVVFNNAKYKADLTDYYFNLSSNITNEITSSPAYDLVIDEKYNSNYTDEQCAIGGIISGKDNPYGNINSELLIDDSNYIAISTKVASSASLKSKYPFALDTNAYYKLTFDLATLFNDEAENANTDKHDCKYGVTISIDGYDAIKGLITSSELKDYTIYLKTGDTSVTPNFTFTLVSDCEATIGTALLTHLDLTTVQADEYNQASLSSNKRVLTMKQSDVQEDDSDNDDSDDNDNSDSDSSSMWLLIPSIITGVAIIIGVVGYFLRKIKIKKVDKIKKESYDRKLAVNHDAIMVEAQKRRDKEHADIQEAIKTLENEKTAKEEEYKEYVKANQQNGKGKISRSVEKAFKQYNADMVRLEEKINILKEKIDFIMSADYLLTLEKKIIAEEEDKFKTEKKTKKVEAKNDKQSSK